MRISSFIFFIFIFSGFANAQGNFTHIIDTPFKYSSLDSNETYVQIDLQVLLDNNNKTLQEAILVNLDSNREVIIYVDKVKIKKDKERFSWFGHNKIEGITAVLSVHNGILIGTVKVKTDTYKITPFNDLYKIEKLDSTNIIPFGEDVISEPVQKTVPGASLLETNMAIQSLAAGDTSINLMLLYTSGFKSKNGASTEAVIQNIFDIAQAAYSNSLTEVNLNLVHTQQLPVSSALNNISSPDLSLTLNNLGVDGYVQHIRSLYGADIVSLIGDYNENYTSCGIGQVPYSSGSSMTEAFSVVLNGSYSVGNSTEFCPDTALTHEVGHNFACNHDSDHAGGGAMYPYAYGYDVAGKFATIMSYDYPEIHFFSNPALNDATYSLPIGNAANADNARTIRENKAEIADNRIEIDESLEGDDSQNGLIIDSHLSSMIDRDSYTVNLGGTTIFSGDNIGYNCWYFYINLYDKDYNLVFSSDANSASNPACDSSVQADLENGTYKMMVFNNNWMGGDNQHYQINISSSYAYEAPASINPAIITYLLF